MSSFQILINLLAYFIFTLTPILIWFSRYNIAATVRFPFFVAAYLIPLLAINFESNYSADSIELLTTINGVGGVAMLVGVLVGNKIEFMGQFLGRYLNLINSAEDSENVRKRLESALLFGSLGMIASFLWIGFLPMFAEDPFLAKFFKGPYKEKYDQIALLFRLSQFLIITALPLAIAMVIERRTVFLVAIVILSMGILAASLTRAPVLEGVLLYLAVKWVDNKKQVATYLFLATAIYLAGSVLYLVLGFVEGEGDILADMANFGATDVLDHLSFLRLFDLNTEMTYGATFWGGLIPGNFKYNPAVFSIAITSPLADVENVASGGFRMPPSIWGYVAFGWLGVVIVPLISGMVIGGSMKSLAQAEFEASPVNRMIVILWYQLVVYFAASFYAMFYFGLLSAVLFIFITRKSQWSS